MKAFITLVFIWCLHCVAAMIVCALVGTGVPAVMAVRYGTATFIAARLISVEVSAHKGNK